MLFVHGIINYGIRYGGKQMASKVQGWCDVNWASDLDFHIYQDLNIFSSKVEVLYHSKVKNKLW
jgi:hypothetical protein